MTTPCLNAVLKHNYRAPHETMLSKAMDTLGTSRTVVGVCAVLGPYISKRGRYDREEFMMRNRKYSELIPRDVSVVVVA